MIPPRNIEETTCLVVFHSGNITSKTLSFPPFHPAWCTYMCYNLSVSNVKSASELIKGIYKWFFPWKFESCTEYGNVDFSLLFDPAPDLPLCLGVLKHRAPLAIIFLPWLGRHDGPTFLKAQVRGRMTSAQGLIYPKPVADSIFQCSNSWQFRSLSHTQKCEVRNYLCDQAERRYWLSLARSCPDGHDNYIPSIFQCICMPRKWTFENRIFLFPVRTSIISTDRITVTRKTKTNGVHGSLF